MPLDQRSRPAVGRLHVLTDFHFQQNYSHAELALLAIRGGADTIQFRQKAGHVRHRLVAARETAAVCANHGVPLIVNDHLELAQSVSAAGVHLGATDYPVDEARRILGENHLIGASATTLDRARLAQELGADYIGFGPVYATGSKANPSSVKGIDALERVVQGVSIPVVAIAGINADRIGEVMKTGAHGVAVMTAVSLAEDPEAATRELRRCLDAAGENL